MVGCAQKMYAPKQSNKRYFINFSLLQKRLRKEGHQQKDLFLKEKVFKLKRHSL